MKSVPTVRLYPEARVLEAVHGYHSLADFRSLMDQQLARPSDQGLSQAVRRDRAFRDDVGRRSLLALS